MSGLKIRFMTDHEVMLYLIWTKNGNAGKILQSKSL